jgi:glucokinase
MIVTEPQTDARDPPEETMNRFYLVGDVGPANVVLAVVEEDVGALERVAEATFASRSYAALEDIIREFLRGSERKLCAACFSVAGPVVDDQVWFPNLSWYVDRRRLGDALGLPDVLLVNDLQATAYALPYLHASHTAALQMGVAEENGMRAVVSAGRGLGEAVLIRTEAGAQAFPSEGGHADFAPNGELQEALLAHLRAELGHVSYEMVCSGIGIPNVYRFLQGRAGEPEPGWLTELLAATDDPAQVIIAAGLGDAPRSAVCRQTLEVFAAILGAETGNLALRTLASGGVYVGGELPARLLPILRGGAFLSAFRDKGKMSDLIRRMPVQVILEPRTSLLGAARYAQAAAAASVLESIPAR